MTRSPLEDSSTQVVTYQSHLSIDIKVSSQISNTKPLPIISIPQQQPNMINNGPGLQPHYQSRIILADAVPRVPSLHVVALRVSVEERRPHVARDHASAALGRRDILFWYCW